MTLALLLLLAGARSAGAAAGAAASRGRDASPAPRAEAVQAAQVPPDFKNLDRWLDYKHAARVGTLPLESRVFFRRGLAARRSGASEEALRLVRGAVDLDPTFLKARSTLLAWEATRDMAQALAQASGLVDLVERDFVTQWSLAGNSLFLAFSAWVLALLGIASLVVIAQNALLRHALGERLRGWAGPASSRVWTWALLLSPLALGFGLPLVLVLYLGILAPALRARERAVAVLLVVTLAGLPWLAPVFDRLALPLRPDDEPVAWLLPLETSPASSESRAAVAELARRFPDDPYARFGAGWVAQNAGDWPAAEAAYRDVVQRWPADDRALDDLGSSLAQQGRRDEAIEQYKLAVKCNPKNATAFFNLSQAYTQGYDFEAAGRAMTRASALDFDRVREYKNQPARAGALDPVAEWLSPRRLWAALLERRPTPAVPVLPPLLRGRLETSDRRFSLLVVGAVLLGCVLGLLLHRGLPLHRCSNCDRVVCRRCSERRRAQALCRSCARIAGGASTPDFARILLSRERQRSTRWVELARTAYGIAFPGAGLVLHHRVWRALMLLLVTSAGAVALLVSPWPFAGRPRFSPGVGPSPIAVTAAWTVVYLLSWLGGLSERRRVRRRAGAERQTRHRLAATSDEPSSTPREAA